MLQDQERLNAVRKAIDEYRVQIPNEVHRDAGNILRALAYIDAARHEMIINQHDPFRNEAEKRIKQFEIELYEWCAAGTSSPRIGYVPPES